jgi:hypothetical protein
MLTQELFNRDCVQHLTLLLLSHADSFHEFMLHRAVTTASASTLTHSLAARSLQRAQRLFTPLLIAHQKQPAPARCLHSSPVRAMSEIGVSPPANKNEDTIFGKISRGELGTKFLYEDERACAFSDMHPQAPTHFLVIPKKPIRMLDVRQSSTSTRDCYRVSAPC